MAAGIFVFDVIATLLLSGTLLYNYGNWARHPVVVTLAVLIAWYFSFLIIFVLPLDVSSTAYKQCINANVIASDAAVNRTGTIKSALPTDSGTSVASGSHGAIITKRDVPRGDNQSKDPFDKISKHILDEVDAAILASKECQEPYSLMDMNVLPSLWRIVYWSSQLLTWIVLPVMRSFSQAGEFTFRGKLKSSLWDNALYYTSYLLIALVLLVYIALQPSVHLTWDRTKAIAAAASNTWGLCVLVLMLGYGLIEVPRTLFNRSKRGYQLTHGYFKVAKLMSEKSDAEETLEDILQAVHAISEATDHVDARRPFVETILEKIPLELMEKVKRRRLTGDVDFGSDATSERSLVRLHCQVIRAVQDHKRTEAQWSDWTDHLFELEDINRNMVSNEHRFIHSIAQPPKSVFVRIFCNPVVEWYWKCLVTPIMLKIGAVAATIMSFLIIWSEVTFFSVRPTLSIFAAIVASAADAHNYFLMEATCLCTIFYLCLCAYYTVFKVRVLNYYYLAAHHHSDQYTLLFSGALLSRVTPPLCLNFLSLIHMDSHVINSQILETAYTQVMGHMDVVPIVSDYFNVYFPIALLALTAATFFSVGARLLSALGSQQFLTQDSELTLELVEEGKEHIKREKRRRQRLAESASRRRDFVNHFGDAESRSSSSDVRQRAADILKSRGNASKVIPSPERSLISNQAAPGSHAYDAASTGDDLSLSAIDVGRNRPRQPPKNIFDDL